MGAVTASIDIDATPETVLTILLDVAGYPSWQGGVERVEVLDADDQGRPRTTRWYVSAMGLKAQHSVRYEYPADGRFEYHLVDSEVMTRYDFACVVVSTDRGTSEVTVEQELGIKWAMPKTILEKNAQKGVKKLLVALKAKAENSYAM